ncbi:unnamed protein product [Caenorhabditis angaria]|uniref:Phospholipase A(2) n=1 Tax=Caenorhabditis angaria TaxID=860376 RepID=A0A9P1IVE8_9PELO|nr:unnamed protein product [Caenorhabditis angaria]
MRFFRKNILFILFFEFISCKDIILPLPNNLTKFDINFNFCGSGKFTEILGILVYDFCEKPEQINHCCAKHDDCYDQQKGKILCDQSFHHCTSNYDCFSVSESSYRIVKFFGENAYKLASGYVPLIVYIPSTNNALFDTEFVNLYTFCYLNRSILSSCVLKFQMCWNNSQNSCNELVCIYLSQQTPKIT